MKKIKTIFVLLFSVLFINIANCQLEKSKKANVLNRGVFQTPKIEIETPYNDDYLYAFPPYPNPAKEIVNTLVYWDKRYDFSKAETNVYNTEGIKICGKERISISQQSDWSSIVSVDTSTFSIGVYILLVKHGSKTISIKIIVE